VLGAGVVHRGPVAVRPTDGSVIDTREFLRMVVKAGLAELAVGEVEGPAVQGGGTSFGSWKSVANIVGCRTTSSTIESPVATAQGAVDIAGADRCPGGR